MAGRMRFSGLMFAFVAASCGTPSLDEPRADEIVTSVTHTWPAVVPVTLENPVAVFEGDESSGVVLGTVTQARLLSDGGAALLDDVQGQLVLYHPSGVVRAVYGTLGAGPGEFLRPTTLTVLPGDTIVVYDPRNRRLTTYAPESTDPAVRSLPQEVFGAAPVSIWRLPEGGWLSYESNLESIDILAEADGVELIGTRALLRLVDPSRGSADTILSGIVGSESIRVGGMFLTAAFGRSTHVNVSGSTVGVAMADAFEMRIYDSTALRHIASMAEAERPLSRPEVTRLRDSTRAASAALGQGFMAEPMFTPALQPTKRPDFDHIVVGMDGRALLREFAPATRRAPTWWVLAPDGTFRGRIRMPEDATILQIGTDYLLALRRDALEIPRVELHMVPWDELGESSR